MELAVPRGQSTSDVPLSECHRAPRLQSLHFRCGHEIRRRRRAAWRRAPTSRSTLVRTSERRPGGDWSFGIHGQPDKTVCLMTYWHVDRHFSSCSARRACRPGPALSHPLIGLGPPAVAVSGSARCRCRAFIAVASWRPPRSCRVLLIRSHVDTTNGT